MDFPRCPWPRTSLDELRHGPQPVRLAKYMAHAGVASRRAAETVIAGLLETVPVPR